MSSFIHSQENILTHFLKFAIEKSYENIFHTI